MAVLQKDHTINVPPGEVAIQNPAGTTQADMLAYLDTVLQAYASDPPSFALYHRYWMNVAAGRDAWDDVAPATTTTTTPDPNVLDHVNPVFTTPAAATTTTTTAPSTGISKNWLLAGGAAVLAYFLFGSSKE